MSAQTAQLIVLVICGAALVVWLAAVLLWLLTRTPKLAEPLSRKLPGKDTTEVRDSLSRAAALQVPPWELEGGDEEGVLFTMSIPGRPELLVEVESDAEGGALATARFTRRESPGWYRWLMSIWLLLLIPGTVVIGAALMLTLVVHHADPNVRGQAIQMAQVVHFLWPPFVFWGIRQALFRMARYQRKRFLTTLELL